MNNLPNRFERKRNATRQKLRQSALALILEKGFDAVTIQEITERADVARATFYLHYRDKIELFLEYFQEFIQDYTTRMVKLYGDGTPDRSLLYCDLLVTFQFVEQNRDLFRAVLASSQVAVITNQIMAKGAANVEREVRSGLYSITHRVPEEILLQFITGASVQVLIWWLVTSNPYPPETMADMLSNLLRSHMRE